MAYYSICGHIDDHEVIMVGIDNVNYNDDENEVNCPTQNEKYERNTGGQLANENGEEEDEEDENDVDDGDDDKGDVDADLLAIMTRPKFKSSQGCSIAHEFWAAHHR